MKMLSSTRRSTTTPAAAVEAGMTIRPTSTASQARGVSAGGTTPPSTAAAARHSLSATVGAVGFGGAGGRTPMAGVNRASAPTPVAVGAAAALAATSTRHSSIDSAASSQATATTTPTMAQKPQTAGSDSKSAVSKSPPGSALGQSRPLPGSVKHKSPQLSTATSTAHDGDQEEDEPQSRWDRVRMTCRYWFSYIKEQAILLASQGHSGAITGILSLTSKYWDASVVGGQVVYLLTSSMDGDIRMYNVETAQCVRLLSQVHPGGVSCMMIDHSSAGKLNSKPILYTAGMDGIVKSFDCRTMRPLHSYQALRGPVPCVLAADGRVFVGTMDGPVFEISLSKQSRIATFGGHQKKVTALRYWRDASNNINNQLVSCSLDGTVRIINLASGSVVRFVRAGAPVIYASLSKTMLTCGGQDGNLRVLNLVDGSTTLTQPSGLPSLTCCHLIGDTAFCASTDAEYNVHESSLAMHSVRMNGHDTPRVIHPKHREPITQVRAYQQTVWCGSDDGSVHEVSLLTGHAMVMYHAYPRRTLMGAASMAASAAQIMSVPLTNFGTTIGEAFEAFRIAHPLSQAIGLTMPGFLGRFVPITVFTIITLLLVAFNVPHRVKHLLAAVPDPHSRKAKALKLLHGACWGAIWALTTIFFMPVVEFLLSPNACYLNVMAEAQDNPCNGTLQILSLLVGWLLLIPVIPLGIRLSRVDGNLQYIKQSHKHHWLHWGHDKGLMMSHIFVKTGDKLDTLLTVFKVMLAILQLLTPAASVPFTAIVFITSLLVLFTGLMEPRFARESINIIDLSIWTGSLWLAGCAIAGATVSSFPSAPGFGSLLVAMLVGAVGAKFFFRYKVRSRVISAAIAGSIWCRKRAPIAVTRITPIDNSTNHAVGADNGGA